MGAEIYSRITGLTVVGPDDYMCGSSHKSDGPWWQRTASIWWGERLGVLAFVLHLLMLHVPPYPIAFFCVPTYSLFLSLRNQAPLWRKEMASILF